MDRLWQYYGNFQSVRGSFGGLPSWARTIVFLAALPGIILIALSFLALLVSILALLLLAVPVYRILRGLTATGAITAGDGAAGVGAAGGGFVPAGPRKRVEATVIDPAPGVDET